jgi:hypothetical protein
MSRENVEVVAASLQEFKITRRPTGFQAPDWVWDMRTFRGWPDEPEYRGPEGYMEFLARWTEPYDEWDFDVEDLVDAGDDRVVAVIHQRGRLRGADSWVRVALRHRQHGCGGTHPAHAGVHDPGRGARSRRAARVGDGAAHHLSLGPALSQESRSRRWLWR